MITDYARIGLRNLLYTQPNKEYFEIGKNNQTFNAWLDKVTHEEFFKTILPTFTDGKDDDGKLQILVNKISELLDDPETLSPKEEKSGTWFKTRIENFIKRISDENSSSGTQDQYINENRSRYLIDIINDKLKTPKKNFHEDIKSFRKLLLTILLITPKRQKSPRLQNTLKMEQHSRN